MVRSGSAASLCEDAQCENEITDGHLQNNILTIIGKDNAWLQEELKKQGYQSIHEVYLGEYNKGELKLFPYKS